MFPSLASYLTMLKKELLIVEFFFWAQQPSKMFVFLFHPTSGHSFSSARLSAELLRIPSLDGIEHGGKRELSSLPLKLDFHIEWNIWCLSRRNFHSRHFIARTSDDLFSKNLPLVAPRLSSSVSSHFWEKAGLVTTVFIHMYIGYNSCRLRRRVQTTWFQ